MQASKYVDAHPDTTFKNTQVLCVKFLAWVSQDKQLWLFSLWNLTADVWVYNKIWNQIWAQHKLPEASFIKDLGVWAGGGVEC